jgi:ketosteroid isomerase-like protein
MPNIATRSPSDVIRDLFAATDALDTEAKLAFLTDDIRLRFANADAITGKDAFRQTSDQFNASLKALRHQIEALHEVPGQDVVVAELEVHYTRLDGNQLALPCCNVFRFRDGLIADYRIYMDMGPVYA